VAKIGWGVAKIMTRERGRESRKTVAKSGNTLEREQCIIDLEG
jgi:hypothetical protein